MSNNIFVLYDSEIETEISLSKFNKILILAGIPEDKIKHISLTEYTEYLTNNDYKFYPYVIAINQTFKIINQLYSEKLSIPIFDFFTKEFSNKKNNLILFGLLFSVNSMYETAYKKYAWTFIQKFTKEYENFNKDNVEELDCDYLDSDVSFHSITEEETIVTENTNPIIEEEHSIEIQTEIIESELSYEFLLNFYNNNKELFKYFNLIQDQLKSINSSNNV